MSLLKELQSISHTLTKINRSVLKNAFLKFPKTAITVSFKDGLKSLPYNLSGQILANILMESGVVTGKLGQVLSTRPDIVGSIIAKKLSKLQDSGNAISRKSLEQYLRSQFETWPFSRFQWRPIGVGTVGQVHSAKLKNGTEVVVKIIKPGVQKTLQKDIKSFRFLAKLLSNILLPRFSNVIKKPLNDLLDSLEMETDLENEAQNIKKLKKMTKDKKIYFPKVYEKYSCSNVLVMEKITGKPLSKVSQNDKEAHELGVRVLKELLLQAFGRGFFHADPHPGNLILMKDGRLAFIDLGLVGEFPAQDRKKILKAVKAFLSGNKDKSFKALLELGQKPNKFNEEKFKEEVKEVLEKHKEKITNRLKSKQRSPKSLDNFINDLFIIAYKHGLIIPPATSLLIKALVTVEGVARKLNPKIKVSDVIMPVFMDLLTPRWLRWLR